jgi:MFS family permease
MLMAGMLVNTAGMGFIWPFLNVYLKEELGIPLSMATLLPLLEQCVSLFSTLGAGWFTDRFGRKLLMAFSLGVTSLVYVGMSLASAWWMFAILLTLRGFFMPLYRVAADVMVGDLIPDEQKRLPAYAMLRTANNVGWAIGPGVGGFVAAISYQFSFLAAAGSLMFFAVLVATQMRETLATARRPLDGATATPKDNAAARSGSGYGRVLRDTFFLGAVLAFTFNGMGAGLPFQLLAVYGKETLSVSEAQVGLVMVVNAMMVVLFQVPVAQAVRKRNSLRVLAVGALFYAAGISSVVLASQALGFALSMVVITIGELLIAPTFTSFAVNQAPAEMRGRYMSVYWIGWSFSRGIGPALAGRVYDNLSPSAVWFMGGAWCLLAAGIFAILSSCWRPGQAKQPATPS